MCLRQTRSADGECEANPACKFTSVLLHAHRSVAVTQWIICIKFLSHESDFRSNNRSDNLWAKQVRRKSSRLYARFSARFLFILFIYLTTIKHNYRLHQANISMKKNHSLREQWPKALTCKAMDNTSSCKSYYIQMYRIKKKKN